MAELIRVSSSDALALGAHERARLAHRWGTGIEAEEERAAIRARARAAAAQVAYQDIGSAKLLRWMAAGCPPGPWVRALHVARDCAHCGRPVPPELRADARYCSRDCVRAAWKARRRPPVGSCAHCGASLEGMRPTAKFCSEGCRITAWKARRAS